MPTSPFSHRITCIGGWWHQVFILFNSWKCILRDVSHTLIRNAQNLQKDFWSKFDKRWFKDLFMPLWCFLHAIPFQCNFCSCVSNCLLFILLQNWLGITQDVGVHYQMVLMWGGPFMSWKAPMISFFNNEFMHLFLMCS